MHFIKTKRKKKALERLLESHRLRFRHACVEDMPFINRESTGQPVDRLDASAVLILTPHEI